MADPAELNRMCSELGVSRAESLYYLEGFDWILASATEACRIKTLPPVKVKSSPEVSNSTAAESSATRVTINRPRILNQGMSTPPRTINSRRSSNQCPSAPARSSTQVPNPAKELSSELKKECIDQFREVAYGMSLEEVVTLLERFNWDVNIALDHHFMDQRLPQHTSDDFDGSPTIDQSYLQRIPKIRVSNLLGFSQGETSAASAAEMMEHRGPPLPPFTSRSQFHIGSSSSSSGIPYGDDGDVDDSPENYIPMIGVSNLEGFSQDETSAALAAEMMEHRGSPLPPFTSKSQFHIGSSSSSGLMNVDVAETGGLPQMSSSQMQIQEGSSPAQIREEPPPPYKVDRICNETGVCRDEALYYLQGFDWDLASAMEACRSKTLPSLKGKSLPGFSMNEISAASEWESQTSRPVVINSRRISNEMRIQPEHPPPKKEELLSESNDEIITKFCDFVGAPPEVAVAYLNRCEWHVDNAINNFMDECSGNSNPQRISEGDCSTMGQSNSQWPSEGDHLTTGFSEDVPSKALSSERRQNMCPPVPLMGLPSQSQFQASGSSSPSLMNVDLTETKESLKEARDESVLVATPPLASSQVDNKMKGKAVEEDSSTETCPDPLAIQDRTSVGHQAAPTTITITIVLADGGSGIPVDIPFSSDQTIRDIRNAINERTPLIDKDYDLESMAEVDCRDMNVTVGRIFKGGSTILLQVFPDP